MALAGTRVVRAVAAEIGNEELAMLDRDGNPGTVFDALLRRAGLGWLPAYATRQVAADGHPHPDPGIGPTWSPGVITVRQWLDHIMWVVNLDYGFTTAVAMADDELGEGWELEALAADQGPTFPLLDMAMRP